MSSDKLPFIAFEPSDGQFVGLLSMEALLTAADDVEPVLAQAALLYEQYISRMRSMIAEIQALRSTRELTPARKIWQVGNAVFELTHALARLSLQLDGLYDHLARDLGVKRKWLEKAIIFRRYLPSQDLIPESLNWGRCEKGTRRNAERLRNGLEPVAAAAKMGRSEKS